MNVFLIYVQDENYCQLYSDGREPAQSSVDRVSVMAFPPLGIQKLAPVLREHGHTVRLFDTSHPFMKAEHIAAAAKAEHPDVIALSFLSTTTYPAVKAMARCLKAAAPEIPIIVGGAFASGNAALILKEIFSFYFNT